MPGRSTEPTPEILAERARAIASAKSPDEAMRMVIDLALDVIACDYASITLVRSDRTVETAMCSDPLIEQADRLQYELSEGPCLTAAVDGGVYVIPDTTSDPRWPHWGPKAAALGLHSVLSAHLFTGIDALGALNLYAGPSYRYSEVDVATAQIVAAHASVAAARSRSERNLWAAIDSRHLIGLAQGVLVERYRLDQDSAFAVLKRYSQQHNMKLRDVAAQLLRNGRLPSQQAVEEPAGPVPEVSAL